MNSKKPLFKITENLFLHSMNKDLKINRVTELINPLHESLKKSDLDKSTSVIHVPSISSEIPKWDLYIKTPDKIYDGEFQDLEEYADDLIELLVLLKPLLVFMTFLNLPLDTLTQPRNSLGKCRQVFFYIQITAVWMYCAYWDIQASFRQYPLPRSCIFIFNYFVGFATIASLKATIFPSRSNRFLLYFSPMFFNPYYYNMRQDSNLIQFARIKFKHTLKILNSISFIIFLGFIIYRGGFIKMLSLGYNVKTDWIDIISLPFNILLIAYSLLPVVVYLTILAAHYHTSIQLNNELYWSHYTNKEGKPESIKGVCKFENILLKFLYSRNCLYKVCNWSKNFFAIAVSGYFTQASLMLILFFATKAPLPLDNLAYMISGYFFSTLILMCASLLSQNFSSFPPMLLRGVSKCPGWYHLFLNLNY